MPNRILKESICISSTINKLSWFEEIMFYRLIVSADDFGRYDARLPILKGRMFPLDADVTVDELEEGLERLEEVGLIKIYHVDDQPYLQILSWADHQSIRAQKAKFPAPPDGIGIEEHSLPSECDVEALLFDYIGNRGEIFGHRVVTSDRQLRIDQSYMDIVVKTPSLTLILELKRGRLSNKAINQIERYMRKAGGYGVLIGCGLAGNFNLEECKEKDIAVITYDDNLNFALVQASSTVKQCYLTLNNNEITENNSYSMLASNPIQSESNPYPNLNPNPNTLIEQSDDRFVVDNENNFEKFWESYPRKVGKKNAQSAWKRLKVKPPLFERIMSSLELQKQSEQWRKDKGKFVPYPATWLNGERWEDSVEHMGAITRRAEPPPNYDDGEPDFIELLEERRRKEAINAAQ